MAETASLYDHKTVTGPAHWNGRAESELRYSASNPHYFYEGREILSLE
jgi:hypothetical protein